MNIILISYDLKGLGRSEDYESIKNLIVKTYGNGNYCKPLESFWLVRTSKNTLEMHNEIWKLLKPNDLLLCIDVTRSGRWGTIDPDNSNWMMTNMPGK